MNRPVLAMQGNAYTHTLGHAALTGGAARFSWLSHGETMGSYVPYKTSSLVHRCSVSHLCIER